MNITNNINYEFLCVSKNGKRIVFDPVNSHAAIHFNDASELKNIVIKVIESKELNEAQYGFDMDMKKMIGCTDVVTVNVSDEIVYAKRKNRNEYVPFVKYRDPEPTCYVSVSLLLGNKKTYELTSAWFGEFESPPFPGEVTAKADSISFWNTHAFVWGSQSIQDDTITKVCPW